MGQIASSRLLALTLSAFAVTLVAACKTNSGSGLESRGPEPMPQGTSVICDDTILPLRGYTFASDTFRIDFDAEGKKAFSVVVARDTTFGTAARVARLSIANLGLSCAVILTYEAGTEYETSDYYVVGPQYAKLTRNGDFMELRRVQNPQPMNSLGGPQPMSNTGGPQPQGTAVNCSDTLLPLRGYTYKSRAMTVEFGDEVDFENNTGTASFIFGATERTALVSVSNRGFSCLVVLTLDADTPRPRHLEYALGEAYRTLIALKDGMVLTRTRDPEPSILPQSNDPQPAVLPR